MHLKYGVIFWGSSSSSMKRVFMAQKRAIRAMLIMRPRSSCREVFRELGTLTVSCLFMPW
jgi:hypothetical protein